MTSLSDTLKSELCLKCMECCKKTIAPLVFRDDDQNAIDFYKIKGFRVIDRHGQLGLVIETPCEQLAAFGCKMYNDRPKWCRLYDGTKDPFMEGKCLWEKE